MLKWKSNDISHNVEQPQQPASELVVPPTGSKGSNTKKPVTSVKSGKLISHTVSPKKIAANQKNGHQSPGPKTAKGKAISSWNAFEHGLLSKRLMQLNDENAKDYTYLLASLLHDLQPVGTLEEMLVEKIAYIYFKIAAAAKYEDDNHLTLLSMPAGGNLTRYQTMLFRQFDHAINQLERLQRQRQGENVPAPLSVHVLHEVAGGDGDQENSK